MGRQTKVNLPRSALQNIDLGETAFGEHIPWRQGLQGRRDQDPLGADAHTVTAILVGYCFGITDLDLDVRQAFFSAVKSSIPVQVLEHDPGDDPVRVPAQRHAPGGPHAEADVQVIVRRVLRFQGPDLARLSIEKIAHIASRIVGQAGIHAQTVLAGQKAVGASDILLLAVIDASAPGHFLGYVPAISEPRTEDIRV